MKGRGPFNITQLSFVPSVDVEGGLAARPYCFFIFFLCGFHETHFRPCSLKVQVTRKSAIFARS